MSNFWDLMWLMVSFFFFVAYLLIMFQIVADLFRDSELGGVAKALWLVALVFLPVATALVYVIARGRGMADRQLASARQAKSEADNAKACTRVRRRMQGPDSNMPPAYDAPREGASGRSPSGFSPKVGDFPRTDWKTARRCSHRVRPPRPRCAGWPGR